MSFAQFERETIAERTRAGKLIRGKLFDKNAMNTTLKSPLVVGRVPYKDQILDGAHEAIVDARV